MLILGIETSCDETAAAVVQDGRTILSNVVASSAAEQGLYGGVVPEIASRRHIEYISDVVQKTLDEAKLAPSDLDAVAVTYAPGLIGALLVGVNFAKGLAFSASKPLVPVHHLRGHIASLYLQHTNLQPPFLCLVASGGHCHLVQVKDYTHFEVLGRTVDDAAGEAFDKVARTLGLGYPGGPAVSKAAKSGDASAYKLPTPRVAGPYDVSFSGLKTAVMNIVNQAKMRGETIHVPSLAAAFEQKATDILVDILFRATKDTQAPIACLAGGVAANHLLRERATARLQELNVPLLLPDIKLCGDNAAMIAAAGFYEFAAGSVATQSLNAYASMPIQDACPDLATFDKV